MTDGKFEVVPGPILERLRCPVCGDPLGPLEGGAGLVCPTGHRLPVHDGYLDCTVGGQDTGSTARTLASFGFEWNSFDDVRDEDAEFARSYFRDLDLAGLAGKVGLDAGCGKGRYTRFLAEHLEALAALDGSSAVEAAARNLCTFPSVAIVKADLRRAPFAPASFDFIASLGVLHHLDQPREGFECLVGLLAPGGQVLLYLYSRPADPGLRRAALAAAAGVRRVTVRMTHRSLRVVSAPLAALLYAGVVVPGRLGERYGNRALAGLPMAAYRGKPLRSLVLDTFDRLSAPVEHRYVWEELAPWFDQCGLTVDAARDEAGWFVLATKK